MELEKLPNSLSFGMKFRLSNDIDKLKHNLREFRLDRKLETGLIFNHAKCMLDSYNEGRKISNIVRLMYKNNYNLLDKKESGVLVEDLIYYSLHYFSDSQEKLNRKIKKMNLAINDMYLFAEENSLDLYKFIEDIVKRHDTERTLEITYADRWIMYNKLFSTK